MKRAILIILWAINLALMGYILTGCVHSPTSGNHVSVTVNFLTP